MDKPKRRPSTTAIHAGEEPDPLTGALVPPVYLASTFHLGSAEDGAAIFAGDRPGFVYSRWGNPTVSILEKRIAALEGAPAAIATASGMAAIATSLQNVLRAGDHMVSAAKIYPSAYHLFDHQFRSLGIDTTFVDATDPENVARAVKPSTKVIYIETPGNPILSLCDLQAISDIARSSGAITICDNTFATPINQTPLDFGVDVVIHSMTKYFCGHGDAVGGMIVGGSEFCKQCADEPLRYYGGILSPMSAYLILRGIMTLPLRIERHNANAIAVAQFLQHHPTVSWVSYPGLESHPQYGLANKQMRGFGGMVCFDLKGGVSAGTHLMNTVKLCALAVSFGDARSLIVHPASTTHSVVTREQRISQGVTDGLVRLSVGLEDVQDIIADLDQALPN